MTVKIGSLFSGIGGFELGLERAIPGAITVWQCEQNKFCQKVLKKHWSRAIIYDDVKNIDETVEPVDLLCGGFPCQDISNSGQQRGIKHGTRSGLWWEMHRITRILQPRIVIMENVAAILSVGGRTVLGSLTEIGYDCEWTVISSGSAFGLPHQRKRWFGIAYPTGFRQQGQGGHRHPQYPKKNKDWKTGGFISAVQGSALPFMCRTHNGFPKGLASNMMKALGNAITPQSSQWIGEQIVQSGLLDDLIGGEV